MFQFLSRGRSLVVTVILLAVAGIALNGCRTRTTDTLETVNMKLTKMPKSIARNNLLRLAYEYNDTANLPAAKKVRRLKKSRIRKYQARDGSGIVFVGNRLKRRTPSYDIVLYQVRKNASIRGTIRTIKTRRSQGGSTNRSHFLRFKNLTFCIARVKGKQARSYRPFRDLTVVPWAERTRGLLDIYCIGTTGKNDRQFGNGMTFKTKAHMVRFASVLKSAFPQIKVLRR